jgi:hypothetical protein
MDRWIASIVFVLCVGNVGCQNKLFHSGTSWFAENKDDSFYKQDTVQIISYATKDKRENAVGYLGGSDYIEMFLQPKRKMKFQTFWVKSWVVEARRGEYTWRYDNKKNELKLFFNSQLFAHFSLIDAKPIEIDSKYASDSAIKTFKVIMNRVSSETRLN